MAPRQRFVSDGKDVVTAAVESSVLILQAIEMDTYTDAHLMEGLESEIKANISLKTDWNESVKWFAIEKKKHSDFAKDENYHLALHTFSLDTFYGEFNAACRNLKSVSEARKFKFRHYFNLLLRAVRNIKGDPSSISNTTKVYRGCNMKFPNLVVGHSFIFKQFTSTSLDRRAAEAFSSNNGTLFIIDGLDHGKAGSRSVIGLKRHSAFPQESEVLTSPFLTFTIKKIEMVNSLVTTVYLKGTCVSKHGCCILMAEPQDEPQNEPQDEPDAL